MNRTLPLFLGLAALLAAPSVVFAEGRTVARLFWQDDSDASLRYGDIKKSSSEWTIEPASIEGFPELDAAEQSLVQMRTDEGIVLLGVHDRDAGNIGSGWVAIDSGAVEEDHGNHSHWRFKQPPAVLQSNIGTDQGNPAHVYQYGKSFVLANDSKNGFTITSASKLRSAKTPQSATEFHPGGNGHITLAVVENQVAYATWIARDGDDSGRVDVIGLGDNSGKEYSVHCPSGGIHGATYNSGKVFIAPADGICWISADLEADDAPETVMVNHLSLGKDASDAPLRTGAFSNLGGLVLFTAGKGDDAKLCWIDATSESPVVTSLPIELADGESVMTPVAVKARSGKSLAAMFRENKDSSNDDSMVVVDLDPNSDGDLSDATVVADILVGKNQVVGHSGHHQALVLPGRRELAISNPGDGTISIVSLTDFTVQATITVKGTPTRLLAIGG